MHRRLISAPWAVLFAVVSSAVLVACEDDSVPFEPTRIEDAVFNPSLSVDLNAMTRTVSGLYYQDVVLGDGNEVEAGDSISVDYVGWFTNGNQFDTSFGRGPFLFKVGLGRVIPGWDEGVPGVRVGGTRKLVIPYPLGYGERGSGSIPPYSILVFDVTVRSIID